jgi:propanediol dehydratase large subunit
LAATTATATATVIAVAVGSSTRVFSRRGTTNHGDDAVNADDDDADASNTGVDFDSTIAVARKFKFSVALVAFFPVGAVRLLGETGSVRAREIRIGNNITYDECVRASRGRSRVFG